MRLERKVLGYLAVVMAVLTVLLVAATSAAILMNANRSDRERARSSVRQVRAELDRQQSELLGNTIDWATRDDTYEFAQGTYPEYFADNLPANSMKNLDINVFAVYDGLGRLLRARSAQSFSSLPTTFPGVADLLYSAPRLNLASGLLKSVSGVVRLPDGRPMLVAAAPVVPTLRGKSLPAGSLVLGRVLDVPRLRSTSEGMQHPIEVKGVPASVSRPRTNVAVRLKNPSALEGSVDLLDLNGDVATQLFVESGRPARQAAMFTLVLLSCGLLLAELGSVFVLRHGLRGIVLDRILTLNAQVDRIRRSGHPERVIVAGNDEIATLGENVDRMLQHLDESRSELQRTHDELEVRVAERTADLIRAVSDLEEQVKGRCTAEEELAVSESRYRLLIDNLTDTVFTLDTDGFITYVSPGVEWAFCYKPSDLIGRSISVLLTSRCARAVQRQLQRGLAKDGSTLTLDAVAADGRELHVEMVLSPPDASVGAAQGIIRDVTARRRYEDELLHIASHDFLTGLVNRRRFEEELERALAVSKRQGTEGAILWIDLDNFKDVNDTLGHHAGDELLIDIARALRGSVREESVLARLGGDEFAVLLPVSTRRQAHEAGQRLLEEIAKVDIFFKGRTLRARGSMGIVVFPSDGTEVDELLSRADLAMYRAKQMGRGRSVFFTRDNEWRDEIEERRTWTEQIEAALRENAFRAFAQPIVGLGDDVAGSFELFARMLDADGEFLPDAGFIGVAERTGLVVDIDLAMLREATRILSDFDDQRVRVNVNVSAKSLGDERFPAELARLAKSEGLSPERLGIEIGENAVGVDVGRAQDVLRELKRLGFRILLDGFGSGFTSLLHLKQLPIDTLKIDGSFVQHVEDRPTDQHLVRAMVEMARGLGMGTIAGHVETGETVDLLREFGVEAVQGNYVGRPGPAREVIAAELAHSEARAILAAL